MAQSFDHQRISILSCIGDAKMATRFRRRRQWSFVSDNGVGRFRQCRCGCCLYQGTERGGSRACRSTSARLSTRLGNAPAGRDWNVTASNIRLGFFGQTDRMADRQTLEIVDDVRPWHVVVQPGSQAGGLGQAGRRSPEQASATLARFCSCGVFNPTRACRLLEDELK